MLWYGGCDAPCHIVLRRCVRLGLCVMMYVVSHCVVSCLACFVLSCAVSSRFLPFSDESIIQHILAAAKVGNVGLSLALRTHTRTHKHTRTHERAHICAYAGHQPHEIHTHTHTYTRTRKHACRCIRPKQCWRSARVPGT